LPRHVAGWPHGAHVGILEELASLIIKKDGTVDKFIGDAIFAFWNAPLAVAQHEHTACIAALRMPRRIEKSKRALDREGIAAMAHPVWNHVGEAVLGNVGSSDRIDYTAIGDNVNIAARLEGLEQVLCSSILTSGQIAAACSNEFLFRHVDRSQPKGVGQPLDIFELLGTLNGAGEFHATPAMTKLVRTGTRSMTSMPVMTGYARLMPWRHSPTNIRKTC